MLVCWNIQCSCCESFCNLFWFTTTLAAFKLYVGYVGQTHLSFAMTFITRISLAFREQLIKEYVSFSNFLYYDIIKVSKLQVVLTNNMAKLSFKFKRTYVSWGLYTSYLLSNKGKLQNMSTKLSVLTKILHPFPRPRIGTGYDANRGGFGTAPEIQPWAQRKNVAREISGSEARGHRSQHQLDRNLWGLPRQCPWSHGYVNVHGSTIQQLQLNELAIKLCTI